MEATRTLPLRTELLGVLDQQIEMLTKKTFSSFTIEEKSAFKNREQRIRELQQALATAGAEQYARGGVFSGLYT
jgi:hypothetical protein